MLVLGRISAFLANRREKIAVERILQRHKSHLFIVPDEAVKRAVRFQLQNGNKYSVIVLLSADSATDSTAEFFALEAKTDRHLRELVDVVEEAAGTQVMHVVCTMYAPLPNTLI